MVKVVAVIRPTNTERVEAEGDDYASARAAVDALVPEGWEVISYRQE
ncbi:hypothetical protein [Agromyces bauzanensis]